MDSHVFKEDSGKRASYLDCGTPGLVVFQMLIGQDHLLIDDLPQAFVCTLEKILCHGKASVVSRSSAESEHHTMANATCEVF